MVVAGSGASLADRNSSHSRTAITHNAAPQSRAATQKSTAVAVAAWSQIWWPSQESGHKEDLKMKYSESNRIADKNITDAVPAAADKSADKGDTSNATLSDINASFEESIRELDIFLQQQDSDSV